MAPNNRKKDKTVFDGGDLSTDYSGLYGHNGTAKHDLSTPTVSMPIGLYLRAAPARADLDLSRIYSQRDFFSRPDRAQCNRFLRCQRRYIGQSQEEPGGF